ncbi:hypothetical protein [Nocardia sp. IFM 10818]
MTAEPSATRRPRRPALHGRDLLIPYEDLTRHAGYTLTDNHMRRLVRALRSPTNLLGAAVSATTAGFLTEAEHAEVTDGEDPFAGQAPARTPMPCVRSDALVLDELRSVMAAYDAEPSTTDPTAACERDLHYFDRLVAVLSGVDDPDHATAPAPAYDADRAGLYRALVDRCHAAGPVDPQTYALLHAVVSRLSRSTPADDPADGEVESAGA